MEQRFDVSSQTLLEQKARLGVEWGDLLLAYSFQRMARTTVTIDQLFALRAQGLTWTDISRFLRFGVLPAQRSLQTTVSQLQNQTSGGTTSGGTSGGTTTSSGSSSGGTTSGGTTDRTTSDRTTTATTTTSSTAHGVDRKITSFMAQLESKDDARGGTVEQQLATRLDVSVDVLESQMTQFDTGLADLYVAHLIMDRSRTDVSLTDLFNLRDLGLSWTQIGRIYGIPPGQLLVAVRKGTTTLTSTSTAGSSVRTTSSRGKSTRLTFGSTRTKGVSTQLAGGGTHGASALKMAGAGTTKMHGASATKMGGASATKMHGASATKMGGASATKMGGASATKMVGASATKMGGASATKMGGASATRMGGASATKMGGASVTKMGGASVTRMGGASATRMAGGAARVHGNGH
jgi:hypothetical protein